MRSTRVRASAAAVGAAAMLLTVGVAGAASGAPSTWLPDAEIWCEGATEGSRWVAIPPADSLWIEDGPYAGHYVILTSAHYFAPGYVEEPSEDLYVEDELLEARTIGTKKGLEARAVSCDFVSRFTTPEGTFSVVGPLRIAKVSG
ncbi:hypothetical protein [Ornithinimicrobium sp. W1665]|uniref:hypothetical protein n=1 Tax=Ornithinimicrobium sp. W1665 TaxID=3416666 RepID=UPI003CEB1C01